MRLRRTGASSASTAPASTDSSGAISELLHGRGGPRRAAGPEEVGPATLRARFRQRREEEKGRCCVGPGALWCRYEGEALSMSRGGTMRRLARGAPPRHGVTLHVGGAGSPTSSAG